MSEITDTFHQLRSLGSVLENARLELLPVEREAGVLAIEYKSFGKPSGISTMEAGMVAVRLARGFGDVYIVTTTERLKEVSRQAIKDHRIEVDEKTQTFVAKVNISDLVG